MNGDNEAKFLKLFTTMNCKKAFNVFRANVNVKKKDMPLYNVKRDLRHWGLLGRGDPGHYGRFQCFCLVYQWLMVLQWVVLLFAPEGLRAVLADFTTSFGGSRAYLIIPFLVWSVCDAVFRTLYWCNSISKKWITIFDVLVGEPTKFLNDRLLLKFWSRW